MYSIQVKNHDFLIFQVSFSKQYSLTKGWGGGGFHGLDHFKWDELKRSISCTRLLGPCTQLIEGFVSGEQPVCNFYSRLVRNVVFLSPTVVSTWISVLCRASWQKKGQTLSWKKTFVCAIFKNKLYIPRASNLIGDVAKFFLYNLIPNLDGK